eukprot:1683949-Heterocapsa_arctica.AAC.1
MADAQNYHEQNESFRAQVVSSQASFHAQLEHAQQSASQAQAMAGQIAQAVSAHQGDGSPRCDSVDRKLLDAMKQIGNPPSFQGKDEDCGEFSFVFKSHLASVDRKFFDALNAVENSQQEILHQGLDDDDIKGSNAIYHSLVMLCKKSALKLVKRVIDNNGLETWRQLQLRHGNKDSFYQLGALQQII